MRSLRQLVRSWPTYVRLRQMSLPGWRYALRRWRIERRILGTPAVNTRSVDGPAAACEVHIMTYDHDWRMALWTAKSFYAAAGVDWPIVFHEGGRLSRRCQSQLLRHFPAARTLTMRAANRTVGELLASSGLKRCLEARQQSIMLLKMIDCLVLSEARHLLILDSDVLFFRRPQEILDAVANADPRSMFNRDCAVYEHYTVSPEAAKARYRIDLAPSVNAGLTLVHRASLGLEMLEEFLADPDITSDPWLIEQTLQALCGSRVGMRLLSDLYVVSRGTGLTTSDGRPLVAKHYPSYPRPYLYFEGMVELLAGPMFEENQHGKLTLEPSLPKFEDFS